MYGREKEIIYGSSRRKFLQQTALVGASLMLADTVAMADSIVGVPYNPVNTKTRGYAARDTSGKLTPWSFERRAVGDHDVVIDIKFSGICHSDIPDPTSPSGITQGGYANNILCRAQDVPNNSAYHA